MKVFALICAAAIAISTPIVQAADVPVACDKLACTKEGISIPKGEKAVYTAPPCDPDTQKAYVAKIAFTGATDDKYTFVTKSGTTALTDTCVLATGAKDLTAGADTELTCGKGLDTVVTAEVTCARTVDGPCVPSANTVTFACAAKTEEPAGADVAVACDKPACTKADISIPDGNKAVYTAPACDPATDKGYLKQIAVTGATGDKYTFVTKSADTALDDATCKLAVAAKDVAGGTTDAPLTCGKGLDTAITVEVTCARGDKTACVPSANTVTFACAAKTAADTPAPSTGSMLTKANAIVGVISGMVGAIVYFNRG